MPIAVGCPAYVGPGYRIFFSGLTGPVPVDDFIAVAIIASGIANPIFTGSRTLHGSTSTDVILGVDDNHLYGPVPLDGYVAPGTAVTVSWAQLHASGATVDSGTLTGKLWEPVGGVGNLVAIQSIGGGHTLTDIYNAVVRTFPT